MAFVKFGGADIHYTESGNGKLTLFLHTGPGRGGDWRGVTEILAADLQCLSPDLFFRGKSSDWMGPGPYSLDCEAEMCAFLIRSRAEKAHVVGHSYGGAVATRLAVMMPELVDTLTLIEPQNVRLLDQAGETEVFYWLTNLYHTFFEDIENGREREAWQRFIDFYNEEGRWHSLPETVQSRILSMSDKLSVMWKALSENPSTLQNLSGFTMPTLVIVGSHTTMPERLVCKILHEHIPNSRKVTIEGARHMAPVTHPNHVAAAIANHVQ